MRTDTDVSINMLWLFRKLTEMDQHHLGSVKERLPNCLQLYQTSACFTGLFKNWHRCLYQHALALQKANWNGSASPWICQGEASYGYLQLYQTLACFIGLFRKWEDVASYLPAALPDFCLLYRPLQEVGRYGFITSCSSSRLLLALSASSGNREMASNILDIGFWCKLYEKMRLLYSEFAIASVPSKNTTLKIIQFYTIIFIDQFCIAPFLSYIL